MVLEINMTQGISECFLIYIPMANTITCNFYLRFSARVQGQEDLSARGDPRQHRVQRQRSQRVRQEPGLRAGGGGRRIGTGALRLPPGLRHTGRRGE